MSSFPGLAQWDFFLLVNWPWPNVGLDTGKGGESALAIEATSFRHTGLSGLSVEALYRRGLLEELEVPKRLKDPHSNAVQGPRRQVGHFAGIAFHSGNVDISQWKYRLQNHWG